MKNSRQIELIANASVNKAIIRMRSAMPSLCLSARGPVMLSYAGEQLARRARASMPSIIGIPAALSQFLMNGGAHTGPDPLRALMGDPRRCGKARCPVQE